MNAEQIDNFQDRLEDIALSILKKQPQLRSEALSLMDMSQELDALHGPVVAAHRAGKSAKIIPIKRQLSE